MLLTSLPWCAPGGWNPLKLSPALGALLGLVQLPGPVLVLLWLEHSQGSQEKENHRSVTPWSVAVWIRVNSTLPALQTDPVQPLVVVNHS